MGTHDHSVRAKNAQPVDESNVDDAQRSPSANEAYYVLLAERLEALLLDMKQNGTPASDPLLVRLSDLLVETRQLLGGSRQINESAVSVLDR